MATKPVIIPRDTPRWLVEHLRDVRRDVEQLSTGLSSLQRNEAADGSGEEIVTTGTVTGGDVKAADTVTSTQNIVAYATTDGKQIQELSGNQGELLYHNGTAWVRLAPGTSGYLLKTLGAGANPTWAAESFAAIGGVQGDVLYHNGTSWTRLAPGTSGQFLKTLGAGNNPLWATDAFTAIGGVQGDVLYHNGTTWVRLPAGTDGMVLNTQGSGANPRWIYGAGNGRYVDNVTDLVTAVAAGGDIILAEGTYTLTDTLTITQFGTRIRGTGDNTRIIYTADNHTDVLRIRAGDVILQNFEVSHSTGTGPDWGPTPGSGRGIVIDMEITGADNVGDIVLDRVRVMNTANWGIYDTGLAAYEDISFGDGVSSTGVVPNIASPVHADAEMAARLNAELAAKHPHPHWGHLPASAGEGFTVNCDFSSGSKDITSNVANTFTDVRVGQYVYGTGIPHGTYVTVKTSQSAIKINNKTTAPGTAVSLRFKRATNCRLTVSLRLESVTCAFIRSGGCLFHGPGGTAFRGQQFWTYSHSYGSIVSANQTDAIPMGQEHWWNHVSGVHENKSVYHGIGGSEGGPYKNIDATVISFDGSSDITYYSPYFENAGANKDGIDYLHCYTLSCGKNTSTLLDAAVAGAFAPVSNGMRVTGKGIPAGTYVYDKISNDQLTLSQAATDGLTSDLRFSHDAFGYKEHWWFTGHNSFDINFYEPSIYQSAYRKYVADGSGNSDEEVYGGNGVPWVWDGDSWEPPSGQVKGRLWDGFPLRVFRSPNDTNSGKGAGCSFKLIGGRALVNRAHYSNAWSWPLPTGYPDIPHFMPCPENGRDTNSPWDRDDFVPAGDTTGDVHHPFIVENFQIANWNAAATREPTVWPGMGANNRACFSVRGPFSPLKLASFTDMYKNNGDDSSNFLSPRVAWSQDLKGGMLAYVGGSGSGNGAKQREGFWGISARGQNWRQLPYMRIHPSIWDVLDTYAGDMWMQLSNASGAAPAPYSTAVFKYYTDGAWVRCARVTDAATSVAQNIVAFTNTDGVSMTTLSGTTGDMLYHNGTSWVKRTAGSTDQFLAISGGLPAWRTLFDNANTWTKVQTFNEAADTVKLVVKGHSTQTSALQQWKNSANSVLAYVDNTGNYITTGGVGATGAVTGGSGVFGVHDFAPDGLMNNLTMKDGTSGNIAELKFLGVANNADIYIPAVSGVLACYDVAQTWTKLQTFNEAADTVKMLIKGHSTQTAYLTEWQDSTGLTIGSVDGAGNFQASSLVVGGSFSVMNDGTIPDSMNLKDTSSGNVGVLSWSGISSGGTIVLPSSGTLLSTTSNVLVSGKTLLADTKIRCNTAAGVTFQDNSSTTKQMRFDLSGITAATTRNVKWPDLAGTAVLVGNTTGASGVLGASSLTGQTGNVGSTNLLTGTTTTAGLYRVSAYLRCTTAGSGSASTKVTVAWNDGAAQTMDIPLVTSAGTAATLALTVLNAFAQGSIVVSAAASQNITFTTTTDTTGSPQYSVYVRIEALL